MRKLGVLLRETAQSEEIHQDDGGGAVMVNESGGGARSTTVLELLRERTDGGTENCGRRGLSKHSFRLIGLSCCGATWGLFRSSNNDEEITDVRHQTVVATAAAAPEPTAAQEASSPPASTPRPSGRMSTQGMNLATALEAERLRSEAEVVSEISVSLVRLLAETASADNGNGLTGGTNTNSENCGGDRNCCVCMVREKGSALIPCGHTFCRVCSRELCLSRGLCPLCNKSIFDILDIF